MIYKRRRQRYSLPSGYYRFEGTPQHPTLAGFGEGEYIRLQDEFGTVWRGHARQESDNTVRYSFRDSYGNIISGIADGFGIVLRDEHGNTWRGFIE